MTTHGDAPERVERLGAVDATLIEEITEGARARAFADARPGARWALAPRRRRYRFGAQEQIAYWNLARFAEALAPVFGSIEPLQAGLQRYVAELSRVTMENIAAKLGFARFRDDDLTLMRELQELLHRAEVDMTIFFRRLADVDPHAPALDPVAEAFYDDRKRQEGEPAFLTWLDRYAARAREDRSDHERREPARARPREGSRAENRLQLSARRAARCARRRVPGGRVGRRQLPPWGQNLPP